MTVSTELNKVSYAGNGVTVAFAFPYYFFVNGDLVVTLVDALGIETVQVLDVDYTVTGAGDDAGGTVTMTTAPATGENLVILRDLDITQEIDYIAGDNFPAETHERGLDRLTMIAQQVSEILSRALRFPIGYTGSVSELPDPTTVAGKIVQFSATGLEAGIDVNTIITGLTANITVDEFIDGTDYTSGTTTQLTASVAPGGENNMMVVFDGVVQLHSSYTLSGAVVTFDAAIPLGVSKVEFMIWQPIAIGTPSDGTVGTAKLINNSVTYEKLAAQAVVTGGSASAFTVDWGISAYETTKVYFANFHTPNAGATTLTQTGLATHQVRYRNGSNVSPGSLDGVHALYFDGSNFVVLDPRAGAEEGIIYEYTIPAGGLTTLDISGLDLAAHNSYEIEIQHVPHTTLDTAISMYVNGAYTATDYYNQQDGVVNGGAAGTPVRNNNAQIGMTVGGSRGLLHARLGNATFGWVVADCVCNQHVGGAVRIDRRMWSKTLALVANLTTMRLEANQTNGLNAGTIVRIIRRDM